VEDETFSERSDAGNLIVKEVFGFVKGKYPERSGGRMPQAEKGARGKAVSSFPRLSNVETSGEL
jgi:hypothetical protein